MQVKKDEMQEAILSAGLHLFLEKGYKQASIRMICKEAGTTLGNFYNYFESKGALFEALVKTEYQGIVYFINHHNDIPPTEVPWDRLDQQTMQGLIKHMEGLLPPMTDRFLLLLAYSEGTPYEGMRQQLIDMILAYQMEHMEGVGLDERDAGFADLLAHQLIDGFIHILKIGKDDEEKKYLVARYLLYMFYGVMGVINSAKQ